MAFKPAKYGCGGKVVKSYQDGGKVTKKKKKKKQGLDETFAKKEGGSRVGIGGRTRERNIMDFVDSATTGDEKE